MKIKRLAFLRQARYTLPGLATLIFLCLFAVIPKSYAKQSFYVLDKSARPGMVMSLSKNQGVAELANTENASSMIGVLGNDLTSLDGTAGQLDVQTDGVRSTFVTNLNGDIAVGDPVTVTPLAGIGGKLTGSGWILGTAQASFNAHTQGAIKSSLSDKDGKMHDTYVGNIPVQVKVTFYNASPKSSSKVLENLQNTVDGVAGRHASQLAVILSFILAAAGLIIAGIITNAAVKNAIKSTARQPLAKQAILNRMIQSCVLALVILAVAWSAALVVIHVL